MSVNFKNSSHISHVEGKLKDDLKKYWRGEKDGFVQVGTKKWLYPAKYEKLAEKYKNFEVRPDDVWITGFPRSGTTVTQELVWLLCHNLDFEAAKEDLDERVRYYELEVVFNNKTTAERAKLFPEDEELPRLTECIESTLRLLEDDTKRRVIKTHFPFELLPDDIIRKGCKVVYVCRQPKDVAVSYYHYEKGSWHLDYTGDFKRYWNHFKNGECSFGPYFEHIKQAYEMRNQPNILFVHYEDLRRDLRGYITKIANFLDRPVTEEDLRRLEDHLKFENFKKNPAVSKNTKDADNNEVEFVRKGKVGGWKEYFTVEMNEDADVLIEKMSREIGIIWPKCSSKVVMEIVDVEQSLNNDLLNHFKGEKDGYVQVGQKKWFLPVKYRKLAEEYKNFEVRSDDVWIMGYPRSGTTLTEEIVWLLCHNLDFEGVTKFRPRLFENSLVLNDKTVEEILQQCPDEEISFNRKKESLKYLEQDKTRRVIKTHLPLELLPDDIIKKGCKIIYICRDPKDVSVSYFLLQSSLRHIKFSGDFEKYLQFFRNGNCLFGPHFEHVGQAYSRIGSKNFMFVFFEEFKKDLRAFVTKLAKFLEISLSEEQLKQMEDHLSLDNFSKKMNTVKDVKNQTVNYVRKGKVGGWREHYTEEMIRETDAWIEANKKRIGIKYPVQ
ncbi:uncharacterized protein LOC123316764 [Coccinella septempunctata]|uniref:uncharacterized protein LOC123316764 n=1 Tax=Coccinella septempunctata TaxID=41139 RepID=UPI001D068588|nr:uncharacterized protein LOC123316764 [Coccinella septempunctata]